MEGKRGVEPSSEYARDLFAAIEQYRQRPKANRTPDELTAELKEERHAIDLIELEFSETSGAFVRTGEDGLDGSVSHIDWIRHACKMSSSAAADRVCVGEQLATLPASAQAVADGEIGFAHFSVIARTASALAGVSSAPKISLPSTFCFPSSRTNRFPTAAPATGEIASAAPKPVFFTPASFTAASMIAAMIFRYPVHRQSTPPIASMTSFSCGARFLSSKAVAATSIPGVHAPHCAAPWVRNACCNLEPTFVSASPSTVVTSHPSACPVATRHAQTGSPSSSTVQAPQSPASHPTLVPVSPSSSRSTRESRCTGELETVTARPFTRNAMDRALASALGSRVPAISRSPRRSSTLAALAATKHPSGIPR